MNLVKQLVVLSGKGGTGKTSLATLALLGMTLFGTLFSIYLTFLEPFVIGATCAWCLSSAVIITIQMMLSIIQGKLALLNLRNGVKGAYQFGEYKCGK